MPLSFTNTAGNLFNRLGRYGKLADKARTFQTDLNTYYNQLMAQYDSSVASPLQIPADGLATSRDATRQAASLFMQQIASNAQSTVQLMVQAVQPSAAASLSAALTEVRTEMLAAAASIQKCTVTAAVATNSGNSGDGAIVVSAKRGDGLDQELMYPETAYIFVTADSQTGGVTKGQETLTYQAPVTSQTVWSPDYPINSGLNTPTTAIDATVDYATGATTGNFLTNGSFESFTSNTPNSWTITAGVAATNFQAGGSGNAYSGTNCFQVIGTGTNACTLYQDIPQAALKPSSSLAFHFKMKVSAVPAAGSVVFELLDSTGTVINDDQGVAQQVTIALTGATTSYLSYSGVLRVPRSVPSEVRFNMRMAGSFDNGKNAFFDHMATSWMTQAYPGGPGFQAFSGKTKWVLPDGFVLTTTNNYGGASNLDTFQWLLDRLFNIRSLGLLFPTNVSPTISDSLITA